MTDQQKGSGLLDASSERTRYDLEQLMAELAEDPSPFNDLMEEHLESARFCLLNSMPTEYAVTLQLAKDVLPDIKDEALRGRIAEFLRNH